MSRWHFARDLACFVGGVFVAGYGTLAAAPGDDLTLTLTGVALASVPFAQQRWRAQAAIEVAPERRLRIRHRKQQDPLDALKSADREWLDRMLAYAELEIEPEPVPVAEPKAEPAAIVVKGARPQTADLQQWRDKTDPKERMRGILAEIDSVADGFVSDGHGTATITKRDMERVRALMAEAEVCKYVIEQERVKQEILAAVGVPPSIIGPGTARSCGHLSYGSMVAPDGRIFPYCTTCGRRPREFDE